MRKYFDTTILPSIETYGLEYSSELLRDAELFLGNRDTQLPPGVFRSGNDGVGCWELILIDKNERPSKNGTRTLRTSTYKDQFRVLSNGEMVELALYIGMQS